MEQKNLYKSGIKLGLTKNDIESVFCYKMVINEQVYLSCGPNYSSGFLYGTISPYDF